MIFGVVNRLFLKDNEEIFKDKYKNDSLRLVEVKQINLVKIMAKLPSSNAEIFESFEGKWSLLREVLDNNKNKEIYIMEGEASFTKEDNGSLIYEENVQINKYFIGRKKYLFILLNNIILQYHFQPSDQRDKFCLTASHPDAIKMYSLNFKFLSSDQMIASENYICSKDNYDVTYHVGINKFRTIYNIKGPKKDQNIDTKYVRLN